MSTIVKHPHQDPEGLAWQAHNAAAWEAATSKQEWNATRQPLPDFDARKPAHLVKRVFGAYTFDPATATAHRIATSTAACAIDALNPRHDYHFWHELVADQPDALACPVCLPVKAAKS
ncbi:MAG: hypothetical protein ACRDGQ_06685 [Candidatus Limnocylindrales bacterium]